MIKRKVTLLLFIVSTLFAYNQTKDTLYPDIDALVRYYYGDPQSVNTNHGDAGHIKGMAWTHGGIFAVYRTFIKFDLTAIQQGAEILNATYKLYGLKHNHYHLYNTDNGCFLMQPVSEPWEEHGITWNNQPAVDSTDNIYLPRSGYGTQNYDVDVTGFIQNWINGSENNGMRLSLKIEERYRQLTFASSDYSDPSKHPVLTITYVPPPVTQLRAGDCDIESVDFTQTLYADTAIEGVMYDFTVLDENNNGIGQVITGNHYFSLSDLEDTLSYGTTYKVAIKIQYNNIWGEYGDTCSVTTIEGPATRLKRKDCNIENVSFDQRLMADDIDEAQFYEFILSNSQGSKIKVHRSDDKFIRLVDFNTSLSYNTKYYIKVRVLLNSYFTKYGDACYVLTDAEGVENDIKQNATEVNINMTTPLASLSNENAVADGPRPDCWNNNMPRSNVWYKIKAETNTIKIILQTGTVRETTRGTLRLPHIALLDEDNNVLACAAGKENDKELIITSEELTPGDTYYITVDTKGGKGTQGTFTLSVLNNIYGNIFYSVRDGMWSENLWSKNRNTPTGEKPTINDVVIIDGHDIVTDTDGNGDEVYVIDGSIGFVNGGSFNANNTYYIETNE